MFFSIPKTFIIINTYLIFVNSFFKIFLINFVTVGYYHWRRRRMANSRVITHLCHISTSPMIPKSAHTPLFAGSQIILCNCTCILTLDISIPFSLHFFIKSTIFSGLTSLKIGLKYT